MKAERQMGQALCVKLLLRALIPLTREKTSSPMISFVNPGLNTLNLTHKL
jgi:hypothetical protein